MAELALRITIREGRWLWSACVEPANWSAVSGSISSNYVWVFALNRESLNRKIERESERLRRNHRARREASFRELERYEEYIDE